MEITKKYTMLDFLGEIECDGTVYISIPKSLLQEEKDYRSIDLMNLEKFTRKNQKRFILQKFFQDIPVMSLLIFGKKTTFDKMNISWMENDTDIEVSFNFWDLIQWYPQDEYSAMEELLWVFKAIQDESIGSSQVILKKVKIKKEHQLQFTKVIDGQVLEIPFLVEKITNKHSAFWLMCQITWTGAIAGLTQFSFRSEWI